MFQFIFNILLEKKDSAKWENLHHIAFLLFSAGIYVERYKTITGRFLRAREQLEFMEGCIYTLVLESIFRLNASSFSE